MAGNTPPTATLNCPACDMPIEVRSLGKAPIVVCGSCGTIIDAADGRVQVIQRFQKELTQPLIPLGTKGTLNDTKYMIIGYMVRSDLLGRYFWEEYLLMNPHKGFAWLVQYNGHWTFLIGTKDPPLIETYLPDVAWYKKRKYKAFLRGKCKVVSVLGEFYWVVSTGDVSRTEDFIAPPYILSKEESAGEENWSVGEYISSRKVAHAFDLTTPLPPSVGIGMSQPNKWLERARFTVIVSALLIVAFWLTHSFVDRRHPKLLFDRPFIFDPSAPTSAKVTTGDFLVTGRTTNLRFEAESELSNSWLFLDLTLLDLDRSDDDDGSIEVSYYYGVDSDGAWREGGLTSDTYFTQIEPGRYNLVADVSSGVTDKPVPFKIRAYQDLPTTENLLLVTILLIVVPIGCCLGYWFFEDRRWKESDPTGD